MLRLQLGGGKRRRHQRGWPLDRVHPARRCGMCRARPLLSGSIQPTCGWRPAIGSTGAVRGWEHLQVNTHVQAGAGQHSRLRLSRQAVGSAGSARSCRLVEACRETEQRGGPPQLVRGLQPRGCTQAFCPPHFGVRQAQLWLYLESFPVEFGVGFLLGWYALLLLLQHVQPGK